MKSKVVQLKNDNSVGYIANLCRSLLLNNVQRDKQNIEVVFRNSQESKTWQQLKALFGAWFKWLQDENKDNNTVKYFHLKYKLMFLVGIYEREPMNDLQINWCDAVTLNQRLGQFEKSVERLKNISLSWATKEQMVEYMKDIEVYHISINNPLPIIQDKEQKKIYDRECRKLGLI